MRSGFIARLMGPIESGYRRSTNDRPARPIRLYAFIVELVVKTVFSTCVSFSFPHEVYYVDTFMTSVTPMLGNVCYEKKKERNATTEITRLDFVVTLRDRLLAMPLVHPSLVLNSSIGVFSQFMKKV